MVYDLTDDTKQAIFDEISHLYDLADGIANAVGLENIENPTEQFDVAKPLILKIYFSADVISKIYTDCMVGDKAITEQQKQDMENALSSIFHALKAFSQDVEKLKSN